jgi:dienelactone hydrolase
MGYCFGGFVVVNAAKQGAPLKGVVSFHGRLKGVPFKKIF